MPDVNMRDIDEYLGIPHMSDVDGYLYHHGIHGQKWGVRRYQNPDGTLTPEGKARYRSALGDNVSKYASKGAKIGAIGGGIVGAGVGAGAALMAAPAIPVAVLAGATAYGATMGALGMAWDGVKVGAIYGAVKTGRGKTWARKNLGVK